MIGFHALHDLRRYTRRLQLQQSVPHTQTHVCGVLAMVICPCITQGLGPYLIDEI